jgi:hypothetical protein
MLPVARFIMDSAFAERLLVRCKNPTVKFFYTQYFKELKPQDRARAFSHPLNKVEELLRPGLREFLCQKKSLNFVNIMDRQKILLCRVPKGIMGERPARVLGSLILSKINLASFRRKKRNKPFFVVIDEIHNFTDGIDFETMLAESRKAGVHYIFATQTTAQMRDEARRIFNDRIAFGNASHIFSFRVSGEDSDLIAKNFGNEHTAPELVLLPNFQFKALTMDKDEPMPSDRVRLIDRPAMNGDELPARKAIAWASANPSVSMMAFTTSICGMTWWVTAQSGNGANREHRVVRQGSAGGCVPNADHVGKPWNCSLGGFVKRGKPSP